MFNIGGLEILVIFVVALLVLGPEKFPKITRTVGKTLGYLRRASAEFQHTLHAEITSDQNGSLSSPMPDVNANRKQRSVLKAGSFAGAASPSELSGKNASFARKRYRLLAPKIRQTRSLRSVRDDKETP